MAGGPWRSLWVLTAVVVGALLLMASLPGRSRTLLVDDGIPAPQLSMDPEGRVHHTVLEGTVARYTIDGSEPNADDPVLVQDMPAPLANTAASIVVPTSVQWRHPIGEFPSAISLRARFFRHERAGAVATLSVPPALHGSLPMVLITLPPGAFFDADTGIYVVGNAVLRDDPQVRASYQRANKWWRYPGNFHGRGKEWQRSAHWAYFEAGATRSALAGAVDLRINGNNTRGFAQHALRLLFRDPLGPADPFAELSGTGHRSLVLRASGNDQDRAFLRDALQHRLCAGAAFETSAMRPCVVYVNGAYWGIHDLRERLDAKELARRHGLRSKEVTILADGLELYDGDGAEVGRFGRFLTRAERWNPEAPAFVDSMERRLDVDGFLAYMSCQIILGNLDWPGQNVKWWRYTGGDSARGPRDGRWRYIMGDSDIGFGLIGGVDVDINERLERSEAPTARLFRACLRSPVLRDRWAHILGDLARGALSAERMVAEAGAMRDAIAPEMPRHIRRWRRPTTLEQWNGHVQDLMTFASQRTAVVLQRSQALRSSSEARTSNHP